MPLSPEATLQEQLQPVAVEQQEASTPAAAPQPIKLSGEKEDEVIKEIGKNHSTFIASQNHTKRVKDWGIYHKAYLGIMDGGGSFPWKDSSNCDLGVVEMCVDNIKSRYKLSTIGAKPMFNSIPVSSQGEDKKQQVTDSMNYILENDIDIEKKLDKIAQMTVEYGSCPVKLYWKRDIKETKKWEKVEDIIYPAEREDIEERGALDVIDLVDIIVPDTTETDVQKLPWIYHRIWYSLYDLKKKVKLGFFSQDKVDEVEAGLTQTKTQDTKTTEEKQKIMNEMPEERVEILECYMRFATGIDELEHECVFWFCPSTNTLMKGFYLRDLYFDAKRPIHIFRYKETGSFFGRGIPEMILPYRTLINNLFNFAVNCLMLQILPFGFYRIGSSFKPEEVRLGPGVMIPVDDINDVRIAQFPATAEIVESVVMLIMSFIERQTGISAPQMGKEFPTRKTATEVKTIMSEGNVKHEDRIQAFQDQFADLLKGVYNLYRQNQSKGREGRITTGEDYRFVTLFSAFDQLPDFDFIILGTLTTGNKAMEREDTMGLYSITSQNPLMANWWTGQLEMLKELFNTFGKRNITRFLPPDEMVKQMGQLHQQALMNQLTQAAMGQQPPAPGQHPNEPIEQPSPEGASSSAGPITPPQMGGQE